MHAILPMLLFLGTGGAADAPQSPLVVFVTGDCEYRSEVSMPMIAEILEKHHGMRCKVCFAENPEKQLAPKYLKNISGLEALKEADIAVFFMRYRQLPDEQLQAILDYVESGRPMVGLRTTTHAFRYLGGPHAQWNDGFGEKVFGQKWIRHHGHDSTTMAYTAVADHPIVRGLAPKFFCRSWLYDVMPLHGDCTTLLLGAAHQGEKPGGREFGVPNPVAWTKNYGKARVFFTTLGHPADFTDESMRRLLVNGIYWGLGKEEAIPPSGCDVTLTQPYDPPPTTQAVPDPTLTPAAGIFAANEEGNPLGGAGQE